MMERASIEARLEHVRQRIVDAGGDVAAVTIVAVTKGFGAAEVATAVDAGLRDVGENYAQELRAKISALDAATKAAARWHFIGRLQTNKVRSIADDVALWQSVDRPELAPEIAKRAHHAAVLVQVNTSGEAQKGGCEPEDAADLVLRCRDLGLVVRGLMCVGPAGPPDDARPAFRTLASLADRLGLDERSMGMTDDLEIAVREGSTMVRVGTALFGDRPAAGADRR
jgi:pyridoxal phosphate enzyme (YggS family)